MRTRKKMILAVLVIIVLGLVGRVWWFGSSKFPGLDVNPYEKYTLIMQAPSPESQVNALVRDLEKISRISGWAVQSLEYNGEFAVAKLQKNGGEPEKLLTATQAMNMSANFTPSGVNINFNLGLEQRGLSDTMLNAQDTADEVVSRIGRILSKKDVNIDHTEKNRVFKKIDISIELTNISNSQLESIGQVLGNLPIKINLLSVNVDNKTQKLTGVLKISVVGN